MISYFLMSFDFSVLSFIDKPTLSSQGKRFYFACDRIPYAAKRRLLAATFEVVCLRRDMPFRSFSCGGRIAAEESSCGYFTAEMGARSRCAAEDSGNTPRRTSSA